VIPAGFVQDLLSRCDIVDVVGRHVELKKAGINFKGLCPFHGEKTPSFIVSPSRQTYHCFGCGAHGDAIRFLTEYLGLGFVEAVTDLAQGVGLQVPEDERSADDKARAVQQRQAQLSLIDVLLRAADHYRTQLRQSDRAIQYLRGRGLTGAVAARFGLGYAPSGWHALASAFADYDDQRLVEAGLVILKEETDGESTGRRYDRFRDRIMFPIRNVKGETIGFGGRVLDAGEPKYLNSPETPVFAKGRELYGLFEARSSLREHGYALVTEGYMDVVALAQLGFPNAVATLGTACTADHVHKLTRFTDDVVFSFDGDAAGRRAAGRALEAALPHANDTRTFRFLFLPPEHDPDSYVRAHGEEGFKALVDAAVPLSTQLLAHAAEGCDTAHAEGRSKLLAQARPLWAQLPDGALKQQLLGELARTSGLAVDELYRLWRLEAARSTSPTRSRDAAPDGPTYPTATQRRPGSTRRGRPSPHTPEDRAVQMLFGDSALWDHLSPDEQHLLHGLPPPHGSAIAWLERQIADTGPQPWAAIKAALAEAEDVEPVMRQLADGDAYPDGGPAELKQAVDALMLRDLERRKAVALAHVGSDPSALDAYRALDRQWRALKLGEPGSPPT